MVKHSYRKYLRSPQIKYACALCGATYATPSAAEDCFDNHCFPEDLEGYEGYDVELDCPMEVYVKLQDGRTAKYKLVGVIPRIDVVNDEDAAGR